MLNALNATAAEIVFMAGIDCRTKNEMRRACEAYETAMRGKPMGTEVEVTRRGDGCRVIVGALDVLIIGDGTPRHTQISRDEARLIAKAIADYDRAVAAVGGGE